MNNQPLDNNALITKALDRLAAKAPTDPQLRISARDNETIKRLRSVDAASIAIFAQICEAYSERPALAERATELVTRAGRKTLNYLPAFASITYRQLWQRTVDLATGFASELAIKPEDIIGIYGFGSVDYVTADMACLYLGATSAVLQTSMRASDLEHIVNEAQFASIVVSRDSLDAVLPVLPSCPSVRSLVVMDINIADDEHAATLAKAVAEAGKVRVLTIQELSARGRAAPALPAFIPAPGTDPLATLMYTSGSTGFPKGAMLTESIWRRYWQGAFFDELISFANIGINFYPLNHVMGRNTILRGLLQGGHMHFTLKSDMSTLFEDIRLVRPTLLDLVPRVSDMIYQAYRTELLRETSAGLTPAAAHGKVVAAMRGSFLGDRLTMAFTGSAPTAPEVLEFVKACFDVPFFEGYGSTEAGVVTVEDRISKAAVVAHKLVAVPELGYNLTDKPYPRGELLVKTKRSVPGYFKNAAATAALYDAEGFLQTGDIMEQRGPDHYVWVDRKNNVIKLAQGEFVTIWRLESVFDSGSPYIQQVYLYANSQRAYLLGVVVPAAEAVREQLARQGKTWTASNVKSLLRSELNRVASEAKLRAYEVPRDFLVEETPWTRDNGLLTGINKPARPQLKKLYGERLEALYAQLDEQQQQHIAALGQSQKDAPLAQKLQLALEAVLGLSGVDIGTAASFKDLGGDSLHAVALAKLLEELCGVAVPVATILNPGSSLQSLAARIASLQASAGDAGALATFASVHGKGATVIRAADLQLDKFLRKEALAEAATLMHQPLAKSVKTVLLTGATGFLGRFLCLEWLEQVAKTGGTVYAIVRAANDAVAAERLAAVYRTGNAGLERRYQELAARHLVALAGDLATPQLGLAPEVYERLATEVDAIVHPGALVNHVFTYEQLFEPNVLGTAELIRLALHGRRKRFDYVSTIGVLAGARQPGKVLESAGVDGLQTDWPVTTEYASGYATSKWASEVLLKELHTRFAIPVRVFRPDMILPHRVFRGQINVPDMVTRLLASIVFTGLAPQSYYVADQQRQAHYDGLPVDFIAAAMLRMSSAFHDGYATYQVSNAHWDDGISLDTIVDWVQSAGYKVERVADYAAWYQEFKTRLQALPDSQRQLSSLPILHQWAQPTYLWEAERVDARQFRGAVQRLHPAGEQDIPQLTEAYIHKYLRDMNSLGVIPLPRTH